VVAADADDRDLDPDVARIVEVRPDPAREDDHDDDAPF
jgi:hypothetical protein